MLSDQALEELREIYRRVLGKDLSAAEARERGERLVALVDLFVREGLKREDNGSQMA